MRAMSPAITTAAPMAASTASTVSQLTAYAARGPGGPSGWSSASSSGSGGGWSPFVLIARQDDRPPNDVRSIPIVVAHRFEHEAERVEPEGGVVRRRVLGEVLRRPEHLGPELGRLVVRRM